MKRQVEKIKAIGGNWVRGCLGGLEFEAKIYPEASDYGIENGRVSKLFVRGRVSYDRGWDHGQERKTIWQPIVAELEKFSQTREFKNKLEAGQ